MSLHKKTSIHIAILLTILTVPFSQAKTSLQLTYPQDQILSEKETTINIYELKKISEILSASDIDIDIFISQYTEYLQDTSKRSDAKFQSLLNKINTAYIANEFLSLFTCAYAGINSLNDVILYKEHESFFSPDEVVQIYLVNYNSSNPEIFGNGGACHGLTGSGTGGAELLIMNANYPVYTKSLYSNIDYNGFDEYAYFTKSDTNDQYDSLIFNNQFIQDIQVTQEGKIQIDVLSYGLETYPQHLYRHTFNLDTNSANDYQLKLINRDYLGTVNEEHEA